MDPNLVQLAAAYREAKAQLGDDAVLPADGDSADEEDASAGADDLSGVAEDAHEGLNINGMPLKQASGAGLTSNTWRAALPADPPDGEQPTAKPQSADGRSDGLPTHARRSSADSAGPARSFTPADSFSGARPGYAFQTGSKGTGYYSDAAGAAAASRSRRKAIGASGPAGGGQDDVPMSLAGSAAAAADGNAKQRGRRAARKPDADVSDSEDDRAADDGRRGLSTGIGQKGRGERRSLPGRLRKKLARDREKHG